MKPLKTLKKILNKIVNFVKNLFVREPEMTIEEYTTPVKEEEPYIDIDKDNTAYDDIDESIILDDEEKSDSHETNYNVESESEEDSILNKYDESIRNKMKKHFENVRLFGDKLSKVIEDEINSKWWEEYGERRFPQNFNDIETQKWRRDYIYKAKIATEQQVQTYNDAIDFAKSNNLTDPVFDDASFYTVAFYELIDLWPIYDFVQTDDGPFTLKLKCTETEKLEYLKTVPLYILEGPLADVFNILETRSIRTDYVIMRVDRFRYREFEDHIFVA